MADAKQLQADLGVRKQIWLTEFQAGLDPPNHCLMPEFIFGALHGSFHAARIIAAINQPGDYAVLTWQVKACLNLHMWWKACLNLLGCGRRSCLRSTIHAIRT